VDYILAKRSITLRVFVTKVFRRFQRKEKIDDEALCEAIARAESGLVDAELGRGLIKQRVARKGQGRSGGFRTIVAYRVGNRAVFIFGFSKSGQDNIAERDEREMAIAGAYILGLNEKLMATLVDGGELAELECHG
jgi:hypothetical protein